MKKALIMFGGFPGHEPEGVASWFEDVLCQKGYEVLKTDDLACLDDIENIKQFALVVPCCFISEVSEERTLNLMKAVSEYGVSLIGIHGMVDAFRGNLKYQLMTGAQFVGHPRGKKSKYTVHFLKDSDMGIDDFEVFTEQYFMLFSPGVKILAYCEFEPYDHIYFESMEESIKMPVVYTMRFGKGNVFYCSLGHNMEFINQCPQLEEIIKYGINILEDKEDENV